MRNTEITVDSLKERFKDHILKEVEVGEHIKVYDFKMKDSINLSQRWIITGSTLIILGDCYEAIYSWSGRISLKFLADCNLEYFSSKCQASYEGHKQEEMRDDIETHLFDLAYEHITGLETFEVFCINETEYIREDEKEYIDYFQTLPESERHRLVMDFISDRLDLYVYEKDYLFPSGNGHEIYEFLTRTEHEFMFGCDAWELMEGCMAKTMTPKWHLAALRTAYDKYGDTYF